MTISSKCNLSLTHSLNVYILICALFSHYYFLFSFHIFILLITQSYKLFTPVSIKTNLDIEHFGEKALLEYKDQRELRERLHIVDEQLSNLHSRDEDEVSTTSLFIDI